MKLPIIFQFFFIFLGILDIEVEKLSNSGFKNLEIQPNYDTKILGIQPRYENFEISKTRVKYKIFENFQHLA